MRPSNPRLLAGLSVTTAVAAFALAGATVASQAAQAFRPNFSVGPRAPTVNINPSFRSEPRFQRFNNNAPDKIVGGKGKGKGKGTDVSTNDGGDGRHPGRRPPKGKPPGIGPIIGTGIIGTGVAIGTLGPSGPAGANTPPSSVGPAARNINIPPPGETRFVKDQLVLEFATNDSGRFPRHLYAPDWLSDIVCGLDGSRTVQDLTSALAPGLIRFGAKKLERRDVLQRTLRMLYSLGALETQ